MQNAAGAARYLYAKSWYCVIQTEKNQSSAATGGLRHLNGPEQLIDLMTKTDTALFHKTR